MPRNSDTGAQIIAPAQDKFIKRTPDGIPMEVALTADLRHPNIVRTLRHASFDSQVYLHLFVIPAAMASGACMACMADSVST